MNDAAALFRQAAALEPDEQARADLWRAVARASEQAFGMDGFRDALEHVIELTPEGPARAQLYSELAWRGSNPATWTNPPARETVETWIGRALEQGGSDPAVAGGTLVARTNLDPADDRGRGQGDAGDRPAPRVRLAARPGLSPARALRHRGR